MSPAHRFRQITVWALGAAVVALAIGLLLKAAGVVHNPMWLISAALITGGALAAGQHTSSVDRRSPDDEL
jgi:hypothetical protein